MSDLSSSSGGGANNEVDDEKTSIDDKYGTMSFSSPFNTYPTPYRLESYCTFGHSLLALNMSSPRRILPGI